MKFIACLLCMVLVSHVRGDPVSSSAVPLLTNASLAEWEFITEQPTDLTAVCTPQADGSILLIGRPTGWIATRASYQNYRLRFDYRWTEATGNAGVLVHISSGPKDRIWPECFQLQTKAQRAGDLLPMAGATCEPRLAEGAKAIDRQADASEKAPGEWNSCEIVCLGDTIECSVNGVVQNRVTACQPSAGRIGFQLEGVPYEVRQVILEPLP